MKKTIFEELGGTISDTGIILSPVLRCRRRNRDLLAYGDKSINGI